MGGYSHEYIFAWNHQDVMQRDPRCLQAQPKVRVGLVSDSPVVKIPARQVLDLVVLSCNHHLSDIPVPVQHGLWLTQEQF